MPFWRFIPFCRACIFFRGSPSSTKKSEHEKVPGASHPTNMYYNRLLPSPTSSSFVSQSPHDLPASSTHSFSSSFPGIFKSKDGDDLLDSLNSQRASASSSPSSDWEHDVFLSFRGEDTRNSFTDHLNFALKEKDIDTFRDAEKLRRGKSILPEILRAIEESKFAVIIFSTNYATSIWCLDELAHIVECKKLRGLQVFPVFYHIEPSVVRKQTGDFGQTCAKHGDDLIDNMRRLAKWKEALKVISTLAGWHVTKDRSESEVVQQIVKLISNRLNNMVYIPDRDLVGMGARVEKMESCLDLRSNDVLTIGSCGVGGIGKTTVANEVFKKIRNQFDISGFVSNIRLQSEEKSVVELQKFLCGSFLGKGTINIGTSEFGVRLLKKVLQRKKVLIVLDDVDELQQIEALAPGRPGEENFWGPGSRLIIKTRDKSTLMGFKVPEDRIYEVEKLGDKEAYQLLCQKAFKKDSPPNEFVELSYSFVKYAGGLPLATEVLGSYLFGRNKVEWSEALNRLGKEERPDIFSVLQLCYDGLEYNQKKTFLDIACFFNGEDHVRVNNILNCCGLYPEKGTTDLINKSLVKIDMRKVWVHDLLRCLGWHIVHGESHLPGRRSRLWLDKNIHMYDGRTSWQFEDARNVLRENTGTAAVEGLFLSSPKQEEMHLDNDPFLTMCNLRLLKIYNVNFVDVHFTYLSDNLRFLEWHKCPLESLPPSFNPNQLVEFKMPNSRIERLWDATLSLKMLILMDLTNCQNLTMTPDFSTVPKLETLILEGCKDLSEVHPTIQDLQNLVLLNLKGCANLEKLPQYISLKSLRTFILSGCSKLNDFPEIVGNMEVLSELYLDGTGIRNLHVSIQHLEGLNLLDLSRCRHLMDLPSILCTSLTSLKFLYLSSCPSINELPDNIGCLENLLEFDASDSAVRKVPESVSFLKNLKLLSFHGSTSLKLPDSLSGFISLTTLNLGACNLSEGEVPDDIGDLVALKNLDLSENNFSSIPESISQLSELTNINLYKCTKLQSLPKNLPARLENVHMCHCPMLTISSDGWSRWASEMFTHCRKPELCEYWSMLPEYQLPKVDLDKLEELNLSNCHNLTKIPDLKMVRHLKKLNLEGCEKLSEIHPSVGALQQLVILNLRGCVELESLSLRGCRYLSTIPVLSSLKYLNLSSCARISKFPVDMGSLEQLEELDCSETAIKVVSDSISHLKKLQVLSFCGCRGLQLPGNFADLSSLRSLNLRRCDLAAEVLVCGLICHLSSLQNLDLSENKFETIPNEIGELSLLERLDLSENNFVSLPESISRLSELTELLLFRCTKLQKLPTFPLNLKYIRAQDCPMFNTNVDTLTIREYGRGFCFINCRQFNQDDQQPSHVTLPPLVLFPKYIRDQVYGKHPFEIRFPYSLNSGTWSRYLKSDHSLAIPLAGTYSTCIGLALYVVFDILQTEDIFDKSWESEQTICEFHTRDGHEKSLVFQNFINFTAGSYGLCCYEPRGGQLGSLFDNAENARMRKIIRLPLQLSVITKRRDLEVRRYGIRLVNQGDAVEFVENLAYQSIRLQSM